MRGLLYVAGFYAATSIGSLAGFLALCVQAARRDRRQAEAEWDALEEQVPTQRPMPDPADVKRMAAIRVAIFGWEDLTEWQRELDYDSRRGDA